MFKTGLQALLVSSALVSALAAPIDADARRGVEFFRTQRCVDCHSSTGGKAPDLGRRLDRNYTPAGITARMWNHAPTMWDAMARENIPLPVVSTGQATDLFAYFYAARYFEQLGDAQRGKQWFQEKRCIQCHAVTSSGSGVGPPVQSWESLQAPIILIQRMWNHQTEMRKAMAERGISWPQVSSQELTDMLVYLQNLPQTQRQERFVQLPPSQDGERLFREKGCADCHTGNLALEKRLADSTLSDVAAAMWNHAPKMRQPPPEMTVPEWQQLISYLWAGQFFAGKGDVPRGRKVFESKKCAVCHDQPSSGAPRLSNPSEPYSAPGMVAVLWRHGPAMLRQMQDKRIAWPQFSQDEMAHLIAYLNTRH